MEFMPLSPRSQDQARSISHCNLGIQVLSSTLLLRIFQIFEVPYYNLVFWLFSFRLVDSLVIG